MAHGEILYVKGMNMSESEAEDDNVWDDHKLKVAYDRAVKIANEEVAKRVAMSTNCNNHSDKNIRPVQSSQKGVLRSKPKRERIVWAAGMACRAVYDVDGLEYEAFVMRIINDNECVVKFLGYDNSEIVPVEGLKPSYGKEERSRQIQIALLDREEHEQPMENVECESNKETDKFLNKKHKKSANKKCRRVVRGVGMDFMNFHVPLQPLPDFKDFTPPAMPPPPPIPDIDVESIRSEDKALSTMLMSWYMSGYYTGYYHGMRRARNIPEQGKSS